MGMFFFFKANKVQTKAAAVQEKMCHPMSTCLNAAYSVSYGQNCETGIWVEKLYTKQAFHFLAYTQFKNGSFYMWQNWPLLQGSLVFSNQTNDSYTK